jgi:lipoprotein-anchoring transpeptidase ErfK/SrfK
MAKGAHVHRRRRSAVLFILLAVFVAVGLLTAGAAYAAMRYEHAHADRIMPGVSIEGVDVSGMTRGEAIQAVRASARAELNRPLTVTVGHDHWTVSPATLGQSAAVTNAVTRAFDAGQNLGTLDRAWHRIRDESVDVSIPLDVSSSGTGVSDFASMIAKRTYVAPVDASIGITPSQDDITMIHAQAGAKLDAATAKTAIQKALAAGRSSVSLHTSAVQPKVTDDTLGHTVVERLNQNRLYLYDGFNVVRSFSVATAKPGFTTPTGVWRIYDKQKDPVWHNPALNGWGAGEPAVIPGGPGNPMGPRAIYITAPGLIRIHGTNDEASIGRYASHGCIRMHNAEVEQLYPQVAVGDHVVIVGARPASAAYWSFPPASGA